MLLLIVKSFITEHWWQYLRAHDGFYLPVALFEIIERAKPTGEEYWRLISDAWMRSYYPGRYTQSFYDLLTRDVPPGKDALMTPADIAFLDSEPDLNPALPRRETCGRLGALVDI